MRQRTKDTLLIFGMLGVWLLLILGAIAFGVGKFIAVWKYIFS